MLLASRRKLFTSCYLLQDVNLASWDGETSLHIAARSADIKHLEHPVSGDDKSVCFTLMLSKISFLIKSSILEYLLNHPKVKINVQDSQGRTPLHFAVIYNCTGNAKYLIDYGANLDVSSPVKIAFY